jgi:uncharacterized Tic20 family protein
MSDSTPSAFSEADDRQWASFAHLGGILGPLPSLLIWLIFKDRGQLTNTEGKEALNFQITAVLAYVALLIVTTVLSSFLWFLAFVITLLPLGLWVLVVLWSIFGFQKAKEGQNYRYPVNLRFIK